VRFDDTLDTVLAADLTTPLGAQAAWRQVVDLMARGRIAADANALSVLDRLHGSVPLAVRAASARALEGTRPPTALVRLFVLDEIAVGAPLLRTARLEASEWAALLPALSPSARAILRHRRDLDPDVSRALESFGPVDFVLSDEATIATPLTQPVEASAPDPVPAPPPVLLEPSPFVAVGALTRDLPLVAEALRRNVDPQPANDLEPPAADGALFEISDVVARIDAFQRRRETRPSYAGPVSVPEVEVFRFETDATGTIRWVEGVSRGGFVGITLARAAEPGGCGVDGVAAGAFRHRALFNDARLVVGGVVGSSGLWLLSAVPAFDAASGRFTGYRGTGRRPRADEAPSATSPGADSFRQLVHELRTPTNAIAGFAEMIEHQMLGPVADPYRVQASTIRGQAHGLLSAIDDLDIAARIEAGALPQHPEPVALTPIVSRVVADLMPLARVRGMRPNVRGEDVAVHADARAVERLLARLIATVVAAASEGERIMVDIRSRADGMATIVVDRPRALVGRDEEALFASDDIGGEGALLGTGFALRLVRNLARELGGGFSIGADNLTLRLPAAEGHGMEQVHLN
jgi:signal transduction histidine kinase